MSTEVPRQIHNAYLESNGKAMQGSDCFAFLGEVFVKPSRTFERLVEKDLSEGVCLDERNTCQLDDSQR